MKLKKIATESIAATVWPVSYVYIADNGQTTGQAEDYFYYQAKAQGVVCEQGNIDLTKAPTISVSDKYNKVYLAGHLDYMMEGWSRALQVPILVRTNVDLRKANKKYALRLQTSIAADGACKMYGQHYYKSAPKYYDSLWNVGLFAQINWLRHNNVAILVDADI